MGFTPSSGFTDLSAYVINQFTKKQLQGGIIKILTIWATLPKFILVLNFSNSHDRLSEKIILSDESNSNGKQHCTEFCEELRTPFSIKQLVTYALLLDAIYLVLITMVFKYTGALFPKVNNPKMVVVRQTENLTRLKRDQGVYYRFCFMKDNFQRTVCYFLRFGLRLFACLLGVWEKVWLNCWPFIDD